MASVSEVVAASGDGRTFTFWSEGPAGSSGLGAGDMVVVNASGGQTVLGQVLDVSGSTAAPAGSGMPGAGGGADRTSGSGVVIGTVRRPHPAPGVRPAFEDSPLSPAGAGHLGALQGGGAASLSIGRWLTGEAGSEARLRAGGFNRHTFMCGQSGSGKTYALGVLLERLILQTDLRVAVLDPNADFVHLGSTLPGVPKATPGASPTGPCACCAATRPAPGAPSRCGCGSAR